MKLFANKDVQNRFISRIKEDMIPIAGYDYPFVISRFLVTQEDYCAILGITQEEMKGRECVYSEEINPQYPFVSRRWLVESGIPINLRNSSQNIEGVTLFLNALELLSGQKFRLPTVDEWEFVASNKRKSLDRECVNYTELHKVGLGKPNELGVYDILSNGIELCSINIEGHSFYVGKGGVIKRNEFEVTDFFSKIEAYRAFTFRLAQSEIQICNTDERHYDVWRSIKDTLDSYYDSYTDVRDNWEN